MKLLIIRFSSIGDIVLTTPVIRSAKSSGAEVHFITKKGFADTLKNNPYVDRLWTFEKEPDRIIPELKAEKFDIILDLHHNLRSVKLSLQLRVKTFRFSKINIQKWLLTNLKINTLPDLHIVDRYFNTGKKIGLKNDGKGLDYFVSQEEERAALELLVKHKIKPLSFIAVVTGGAHATKIFPASKLNETLSDFKETVVLLGGPSDRELAEQITLPRAQCINLCGKVSLNVSAAILKQAAVVLTNDTGLMHIAAAFKKPVVSIWGNTIPEFGMTPYYGELTIEYAQFEVDGLACRPCSKIGFKQCPKSHFKCMMNQNSRAIAEKTLSMYHKIHQ